MERHSVILNNSKEKLEIKGFDDRSLGLADRSLLHKIGLPHQSIHLWIYHTPSEEILIQKRSDQKDTFPGYWDVSVAGHIDPGEIALETCIREASEEIGLQITSDEIELVGRNNSLKIHRPDLIDVESQFIYLINIQNKPQFTFNKEEVSSLKWIKKEKLFMDWAIKKKNLIPRNQAYQKLLNDKLA